MFAPLCRLRSIATRSPVASATVSFQEKGIEWERSNVYAFYAAKAYTYGRTPHLLYWRDYMCVLCIGALCYVSRETFICWYIYISLGKNMTGAAKVTWQQRVCRAIMVSSKGEAWHMEPAEGAAAKSTSCPYILEQGNRYDREEENGYSD